MKFTVCEQTPLEALVQAYGERLQRITAQHKVFIMSVLSLYLYGSHTLKGAIDELDPEGQYSAKFIDLVERLEDHSPNDLHLLIATIANQLAWRQ